MPLDLDKDFGRNTPVKMAGKKSFEKAHEEYFNENEKRWGKHNGGLYDETLFRYTGDMSGGKKAIEQLVTGIIKDGMKSGQTSYHFIDLGSGYEAGWSQAVSNLINTMFANKGIVINIYNTTVGTVIKKIADSEHCKVVNLTEFDLSRLSHELQERQLDLYQKVDLVVSSYCLNHLVDPLGTFLQAYDYLRLSSGIIMTTGFHFNVGKVRPNQTMQVNTMCLNIQAILLALGGEFCIGKSDMKETLSAPQDIFVMCQKNENGQIKIPVIYGEVSQLSTNESHIFENRSGMSVQFHILNRKLWTMLSYPGFERAKKLRKVSHLTEVMFYPYEGKLQELLLLSPSFKETKYHLDLPRLSSELTFIGDINLVACYELFSDLTEESIVLLYDRNKQILLDLAEKTTAPSWELTTFLYVLPNRLSIEFIQHVSIKGLIHHPLNHPDNMNKSLCYLINASLRLNHEVFFSLFRKIRDELGQEECFKEFCDKFCEQIKTHKEELLNLSKIIAFVSSHDRVENDVEVRDEDNPPIFNSDPK